MNNWRITFWDGNTLRECTILTNSIYDILTGMQNSTAGSYMYAIISIVRVPS